MLTQFSYAGWKGGKNNLAWRKLAAKEKIEALKLQSKIFNSKITIPFLTSIKTSHKYRLKSSSYIKVFAEWNFPMGNLYTPTIVVAIIHNPAKEA